MGQPCYLLFYSVELFGNLKRRKVGIEPTWEFLFLLYELNDLNKLLVRYC